MHFHILVFLYITFHYVEAQEEKAPLLARGLISPLQLDGRIIGGLDGIIEDYPYQVSIQPLDNDDLCGGTLITTNIVLTAGHCTQDYVQQPHLLAVRAGSAMLDTGGETAKAVSVCLHPKYNFPDYDVSVLKLDRNLPSTNKIRPIPFQGNNVELDTGTVAVISGWGYIDNEGPAATVLQVLEVPKIDQKACEEYYEEGEITDRMFCFGYDEGGKDSCLGDSGGPLVTGGKVVGVISWGWGCAEPKHPGVYVKISNSEIHSHIEQCIAMFE